MHHTFLYISLPFLQDYDVKMANFAFHGERKQATTEFYFSFWTVDMVPWNQLIQEGSPTCEVSGWVGIIATKTGKNANFHVAENVKCTQISLGLIPWGPHLRIERKIRRRFFASFLKREIRHFHVAIVHGDGKEMTYRKAWFTCKVVILLV